MSTKAEIQGLINTDLASGSGIPAINHRNVLKDDPDSILENIYATPTTEDSTGTHTITTPNANFSYIATFSKVGRNVNFSGSLFCVNTVAQGDEIFVIDPLVTGFLGSGLAYGVATNSNTGEHIEIRMNDSAFETNEVILAGERFRFSITYRTLN